MDTNQARDSAGTALTQPSFRVDSQGSQTTSSIEDDVAKIIGPMEGGKVTKVDTIFLQQDIDDIKTKERASGFKFQPFKNLKSKFKAKRKRQKEAIDSAKRTLLSDELDLRAANKYDHEYRKFIDKSYFAARNATAQQTEAEMESCFMDVEQAFNKALTNYFKERYNILVTQTIPNAAAEPAKVAKAPPRSIRRPKILGKSDADECTYPFPKPDSPHHL